MNTPICDFVKRYQERDTLRLHMPGHKGRPFLGIEQMDLTEIAGADELYHPNGIIRESEENAAALFGAGRTVYSTEGSSLCIRAMVYLALLNGRSRGRKALILAGRNAHKAFLSAAALLDTQVEWLYPQKENSLISCNIDEQTLEHALDALPDLPAAVYITTPDYLGNLVDVRLLAAVCHRHGVPLLVDNAHGSYLRFLSKDRHPITLGADLCCDSAHKTLPVLTGGAYLHISKNAPDIFRSQADRAMALFASTSPSYLIMQSLDACNAYLADGYREKLAVLAERTAEMKGRLQKHGYAMVGDEPIKLTLMPKTFGYTGDELHRLLRMQNMEWEFSDPDFLTAMLTPSFTVEDMNRLETALLGVSRKKAIAAQPPALPHPQRVLSMREAAMASSREMPVDDALGRILADAHVGCPPCIPIIAWGERIDEDALRCFRYYGIDTCWVAEQNRCNNTT
ncbi:MAG: aminotransferase class V-fold PLP-dependent enzyme [Clostridia bacterium]|nr:aminotransferase class V-fold PLP-dependent enzyme [Clostridia bacterium]